MPANEQNGSGDVRVFRDLDIELTGWPSAGDGIGFRARVAGEAPDGSRMQLRDAVAATFDPRRFWGEPAFGIPGILEKLASNPSEVSEDELLALGTDLADLALPGGKSAEATKSVRDILNSSYRTVAQEGDGLRIRLRIEVEDLKELPWEFMYAPGEGRGDYLALNRDISIVRTDVTEVRDYRPRSRGAVRLSLVLAGFAGANELKVDQDYEVVAAAVDSINEDLDGPGIKFVGAVDPNRPVDADGVRRLLRDTTDIFYFAGHGEIREIEGKQETVLVLGDDEFLPARGFAGLLAGAAPRLAMLGACDSARRDPRNPWNGMAAELVKRAVPAVVGHQFPILSIAARDFASTVFLYVLQGRSIDEAVAEARLTLRTRHGVDWGIPALYLDNGDGVLFPGESGAFGETQAAIATIDRSAIDRRLRGYSPFRGVGPYQREHRPVFFGRGTIDRRVVEALESGVTAVTVHGPPGCGKTSFLLAGIAGLREGALIRLDDYSDPVVALREKLEAEGINAARGGTWRELTAAAPRLLLVLDQFERVFDLTEKRRDAALEQLELLVGDKPDHVDVLIGIRTRAYGRFDDVRRAMALTDHAVRLDQLTRNEAREVLVGAFQTVPPGIAFAAGLVDDIVRGLDLLQSSATDAIDPTQLQIVGESVFKAMRERTADPRQELVVARADYLGAAHVVGSYLRRELVNRFPNVAAAETVLEAMAASREEGWVRRSGLHTELAEETMDETLRRLARTGFLVSRTAPEEPEYEFAGPAVRQVVTDWAGDDVRRLQAGRRLLRGLAAAWNANRDEASERDLARLEPLAAELEPNPNEAVLLLRSAVANHRDASRWLELVARGDTAAIVDALEDGESEPEPTIDGTLLGIDDETHAGDGFGVIATVAAGDSDPVNRKTAALVIAHRPDFETRLDNAVAATTTGWLARQRRAELWGTVTDADPTKTPSTAPVSLRAMAWLVKVVRRIRHDRAVIVRRAVAAGTGAGLLLGLQRAAITQLTRRSIDPATEWAVQLVFAFVWGFALVAALVAAGEATRSGLRRTEPAAAGKVFAAGGFAFAVVMLFVGLANGLSPTGRPMIPLIGLGCGVLLAAALLEASSRPIRFLWVVGVATGFGFGQWLLTAASQANPACDAGCKYALSLPIVRSASYYGPRLGDRSAELAARSVDWFAGVAVIDAAVAGAVLFAGATAALRLAHRRERGREV